MPKIEILFNAGLTKTDIADKLKIPRQTLIPWMRRNIDYKLYIKPTTTDWMKRNQGV